MPTRSRVPDVGGGPDERARHRDHAVATAVGEPTEAAGETQRRRMHRARPRGRRGAATSPTRSAARGCCSAGTRRSPSPRGTSPRWRPRTSGCAAASGRAREPGGDASWRRTEPPATVAPTSEPITCQLVQPQLSPWTIPSVSSAIVDGQQQRAAQVRKRSPTGRAALDEVPPREDDREHAERDVDQEDEAPVVELDERAAERRPEAGGERGRSPHNPTACERRSAGNACDDERERSRDEQRRARRLQHACRHQHRHATARRRRRARRP